MENPICPVCHTQVRLSDYFCFNCGSNLKPKPLSTFPSRQLIIYLESIFLPPYGIFIGVRYLRQKDKKSKTIGMIAITLTIFSIIIFTKITLDIINNLNTQINSQMQQLEGF